jgi:mono/diheme cytochrome c family protein
VRLRPCGIAITGLAIALSACDNMANQPKLNPFELPYGSQTPWPAQPPRNIVARDAPAKPPSPPPVTMALLERGRERFDINCAPCHGRVGDGNGIIAQRGFPHPPSFHIQRLKDVPIEHFYDVVSNGYGIMFSYAERVGAADRWAIAAYIRALQASRTATVADVPVDKRGALQ